MLQITVLDFPVSDHPCPKATELPSDTDACCEKATPLYRLLSFSTNHNYVITPVHRNILSLTTHHETFRSTWKQINQTCTRTVIRLYPIYCRHNYVSRPHAAFLACSIKCSHFVAYETKLWYWLFC